MVAEPLPKNYTREELREWNQKRREQVVTARRATVRRSELDMAGKSHYVKPIKIGK